MFYDWNPQKQPCGSRHGCFRFSLLYVRRTRVRTLLIWLTFYPCDARIQTLLYTEGRILGTQGLSGMHSALKKGLPMQGKR